VISRRQVLFHRATNALLGSLALGVAILELVESLQ
jgi:hypothetical protein